MENSFRIADLIVKEIKGDLSIEENLELNNWLKERPENKSIYEKATDKTQHLNKLEVYNLFKKEKAWSALEKEIFKTKTISFHPKRFFQYAAAILLPLLIIGGASYLYFTSEVSSSLAQIDTVIKPGIQKATLVLSNGGAVELDKNQPFAAINEGDAQINNEDELLSYSSEESLNESKEIIYNELITPRGGGYNLKLADGTSVWLNAGSKLKFPVSFTDSTRKVFLEGEAYFKVSHNGKPFIVNSGTMDIRVLGTSFNVSAYADDTEIVTTLVEGKVQIDYSANNEEEKISQILTPKKQAIFNKSNSNIVVDDVKTAQYISWMEGKLEFSNESLEVVLKRLARWYNFNYKFEDTQAKNLHFTARFSNKEKLSTIIEMLEMTTEVKFELKNNTIVIK